MKTRVSLLLPFSLAVVILGLSAVTAQAAEDPIAALRTYRYAQGSAIPQGVENAVRGAVGTPALASVETALIAVLESDAVFDAKDVACRQLRAIATDRAVPALAKLLGDPQLNSIARYALEPIPGEVAATALRNALRTTSGEALIGVINSLGARGERESVTALAPLLERPEAPTVAAALTALGRIGSESALSVLRAAAAHYDPAAADGGLVTQVKLAPDVKAKLDVAVLLDAFILCAEGLERDGITGYAAQVFSRVHDAEVAPIGSRMAALRGLTRLDPAQAAVAIAAHLRGPDATARRAAGGCVRVLPDSALPLLLPTLNALPPERLAVVLPALADRGQASLISDFLRWSEAPDPKVRIEALKALGGTAGTAASVARLLAVATGATGAERDAARQALHRVSGAEADAALAETIAHGQAVLRAEAIRAIGPRGAKGATVSLLAAAQDPDLAVRVAALEALADTADMTTQEAILARVLTANDEKERTAAARALVSVTRRSADVDGRVAAVTRALAGAGVAARIALLDCLAQLGGAVALEAVSTAVRDGNNEIQAAAVGALAGWADASAVEPLRVVVRSAGNPTLRTVALRGYLQLIQQSDRSPQDLLGDYREAMSLATRADERRLVLAGLANVADPAALELARGLIADSALTSEAALATARIARAVAGTSQTLARASAEEVLAADVSEPIKAQAREVIAYLERGEGFILGWQLAGPFTKDGATDRELFDAVFPPEVGGAITWRRVQAESGIVPLDQLVGGDNRVAYLRTVLSSTRSQPVRFELGSDDGAKVWLNGTLIHANNVNRGYLAGEDKFEGQLREGINVLLVKVTQGGGGWTVGVRVRTPTGTRTEGIQSTAE